MPSCYYPAMTNIKVSLSVGLFFCFFSCAVFAAPPLVQKPFDCESILANRKNQDFLPADLSELAPIIATGIARGQSASMLITSNYSSPTEGAPFTKAQLIPVRKQLKKLGAYFFPMPANDPDTFGFAQLEPTLDAAKALPEILRGLEISRISVEFGEPEAKENPAVAKPPEMKNQVLEDSRLFRAISIEELKVKVEALGNIEQAGDFRELSSDIAKDLAKVRFDSENLTFSPEERPDLANLIGYHTTSSGLSYLGVVTGGDGEIAIFYLLYWDGSKVRGYIPARGNLWNPETGEPYGADVLGDIENLQAQNPAWANLNSDDILGKLNFDLTKLADDISANICSAFSEVGRNSKI